MSMILRFAGFVSLAAFALTVAASAEAQCPGGCGPGSCSGTTCICPPGYSGANCENYVCSPDPCQNGGQCYEGGSSASGWYAVCNCRLGFSGVYCQTNINECLITTPIGPGSPCRNGGVCIDGINSYTCNCASGFGGVNCEIVLPTATAIGTPPSTATATMTATPTLTDTPAPTATETGTAIDTATQTPTPTVTATSTAAETETPAATAAASVTATATVTVSDTPTATPSPSPNPTLGTSCPAAPRLGCVSESQAKLQVTAGGDLAKWKLGWKWKNGAGAVTIADLGDPLSTTSYTLCVYDETAGVPALKLQAVVDAAGTCGADPCWKALGSSGFSYKNKTGNGAGITKLSLKSGGAEKAKIQIKGSGAALALPVPVSGGEFFDQDVNVTVQLRASDTGACWTSSFASPKKNTATQYKAKTP